MKNIKKSALRKGKDWHLMKKRTLAITHKDDFIYLPKDVARKVMKNVTSN